MFSEDSHPHPYRPLNREGYMTSIPLTANVPGTMWPSKRHSAAAGGNIASYSFPTPLTPITILGYCHNNTVCFYASPPDPVAGGAPEYHTREGSASVPHRPLLSIEQMKEQTGMGGCHLTLTAENFTSKCVTSSKSSQVHQTVIKLNSSKRELSEEDSDTSPTTKRGEAKRNSSNKIKKEFIPDDDENASKNKKLKENTTTKAPKRKEKKKDISIKQENEDDYDEDNKEYVKKETSVRHFDIVSFRWAPPYVSLGRSPQTTTHANIVSSHSNNMLTNHSHRMGTRTIERDGRYHMCAWLTTGNTVEVAEVAAGMPLPITDLHNCVCPDEGSIKTDNNSGSNKNIINPIIGRKRLLICPSIHVFIPSQGKTSSNDNSGVIGSKRSRTDKSTTSAPSDLIQRHTFTVSIYFIHWLNFKDLLLVTSIGVAVVDVLEKLATLENVDGGMVANSPYVMTQDHNSDTNNGSVLPNRPVVCTIDPSDFCILFERSYLLGRNPLIGWWTFMSGGIEEADDEGNAHNSGRSNMKTKGTKKGQQRNTETEESHSSSNNKSSKNNSNSSVIVAGGRQILILHDNFEPATAADPQLIPAQTPISCPTAPCCASYAFAVAGSCLPLSYVSTSHKSYCGDVDKPQRVLTRHGVIKTFILSYCCSSHHDGPSLIPCHAQSWRPLLAGTSLTHHVGSNIHNKCSHLSLMVPSHSNTSSCIDARTWTGSFIPTAIHLSPVTSQIIYGNNNTSIFLKSTDSSMYSSTCVLILDLLLCGPLCITNLIRQQLLWKSPLDKVYSCDNYINPKPRDLIGIPIEMTSSKLVISWNSSEYNDVTHTCSNTSASLTAEAPNDGVFKWVRLPTHQSVIGSLEQQNGKSKSTKSDETTLSYRQDPYVHQIIRLPSMSDLSVTFILVGSLMVSYVAAHYFSNTTINERPISSCTGGESNVLMSGNLEDKPDVGFKINENTNLTINTEHIVVHVTSGIIVEATDGGLPLGLHLAGAKLLSSRDETVTNTRGDVSPIAGSPTTDAAILLMESLELITSPETAGKLPLFSILSPQIGGTIEDPPTSKEHSFYTSNSLSRRNSVHNIFCFSLHPSGQFGALIVGSIGFMLHVTSDAIIVPLEAFERGPSASFVAMTTENNYVLELADGERQMCRYPISSVERTGRLALISEIISGHLVSSREVPHSRSSANTVSFLTLGSNPNSQTVSLSNHGINSVENGHLSLIDPGAAVGVNSDEFPVSSRVRELLRQLIISVQLELTAAGNACYQKNNNDNTVGDGNSLFGHDIAPSKGCIHHFCHESQKIAIPRQLAVDIPYDLATLRRHLTNWDLLMMFGIADGMLLAPIIRNGSHRIENSNNNNIGVKNRLNLLPSAGSAEAKELFLNYLYRRIVILLSRYIFGNGDEGKYRYGYSYYIRQGGNSDSRGHQWSSLLLEVITILNSIAETEVTLAPYGISKRQAERKRVKMMMLELRNADDTKVSDGNSHQGDAKGHYIQSVYNTQRNLASIEGSKGSISSQGIGSSSHAPAHSGPVEGALLWSVTETDDFLAISSPTKQRFNKIHDCGISIALLFPRVRRSDNGPHGQSIYRLPPSTAINNSGGQFNIILVTRRDVFIELWLGYAITFLFYEGKREVERNDNITNSCSYTPGKEALLQRITALVFLVAYTDDAKQKLEIEAGIHDSNDSSKERNGLYGPFAEPDCTLCWSSHSFISSVEKFITMVTKQLHLTISSQAEPNKDQGIGQSMRSIEGRWHPTDHGPSVVVQYSFNTERVLKENYNLSPDSAYPMQCFGLLGPIVSYYDSSKCVVSRGNCRGKSKGPSADTNTDTVLASELVSVINPMLWEIECSPF